MESFDTKRIFGVVTGILAVIWLYTFYQSVICGPPSGYYTSDENFVADSGVFLWYGNTPRCLDWPATPSVLLFFIMFGVVALWSVVSRASSFSGIFDALEHFDFTAYTYLQDREGYILAGRAIQLVLVGGIIFLTIRYLFRSGHPLLTPLLKGILGTVIVTSYVLWFNAPFLRPEALSGSLFIYLLCRLLFTETPDRSEMIRWAALFALIVAERLIFLFVSPLVFFRMYQCLPERKWRGVFLGIVVTGLVFVVFCPFIFTDPFVILKAFGGGILAKMQDAPMATFFNMTYIGTYFENPVSYLIVALAALGIASLGAKQRVFVGVIAANLALFLFLVLRSAKIYDTHVLPAGVITLFLVSFGIGFVAERLPGKRAWAAAALVAVISLSQLHAVYSFQVLSHKPRTLDVVLDWIYSMPEGTRLLLPPGGFEFILPRTLACLERNFAANHDEARQQRKIRFLLGDDKDDRTAFPVVANSFLFEDEALYASQYRLLMKYNHLTRRRYDYDVYIENDILANTYLLRSTAVEGFRRGDYEYYISDVEESGFGAPFRVFSLPGSATYYVYRPEAGSR